jgi:cytochrome c-type biogenesis protein CcmH/NrfF
MNFMKGPKLKELPTEVECPVCAGTDFQQSRSQYSPVEESILHVVNNVWVKGEWRSPRLSRQIRLIRRS